MSGTVELAPDGQNLLIRFPYREDLVAAVKALNGRRWDPAQKLWRVPASNVEQVYALLSRHLFEFAPEISALLAGTLGMPAVPKPTEPRAGQPLPAAADAGNLPPALRIGELNARVRDGLRQQFPEALWVVGEIVDFDKGAGRQHRFFQLVEKARNEARPTAAVEVAMFAATAERLLPALAAGDMPLVLRDGLEVRVLVRVDLYPATGRFQIVVQDIDPTFTLGKLALGREQILRELTAAGLHQRNRQLGFPVPSRRIGVLSSADADGWNDLLRHLQDARVGIDLTLFPIKVQGPELKPTLLAGLRWFADHAADFDLLCIVRGGGSRPDLAWFDDRDIAFAVAKHPLKVIVGIGHQRDQSVLDAIAHSEKTPTAVAELLVRGIESARAGVAAQAERLLRAAADPVRRAGQRLLQQARLLQLATGERLQAARGALADHRHGLLVASQRLLQRHRSTLAAATHAAASHGRRTLERAAARVEQHATRLRLLDPQRVLQRGFVIVRGGDGAVLPASARLQPGAAVELQFRDGRVGAKITVNPAQPS